MVAPMTSESSSTALGKIGILAILALGIGTFAYFDLGQVLVTVGQFEEAIKNFQKAIQIKRDFANAYYNLGFAYLGLGLKVKAAKAFQKAIRLKPALAEVFGNKKVILGRPETEKIFIDPK